MADNSLPDHDLPEATAPTAEVSDEERRKFLRRAALAGLPVILATVRGRTVFAGGLTASCAASLGVSGCANRL
jgi:hypothetical protein